MDLLLHVGGPALLGLLGGGIIGATHYYSTKPMSIKEPDPETGIRNTTLLSYHPTVMGSLHDLVTYRAAKASAVIKMRDALEEMEAITIYCSTAPVHKLRLDMIPAMRKLSTAVSEILEQQFEAHGYATNPDGQPLDPFVQGAYQAIFVFMENSIKNLETTMNERINSEVIGETFVRGVTEIDRKLQT